MLIFPRPYSSEFKNNFDLGGIIKSLQKYCV